ncbi:MAG: hypothetical protein ACTS46_00440 [Candidatus Hodgkinia cicadicola]
MLHEVRLFIGTELIGLMAVRSGLLQPPTDCNFHVTNNLPSAIKLINNVIHSTNRCWEVNQSNSLNIFNLRNATSVEFRSWDSAERMTIGSSLNSSFWKLEATAIHFQTVSECCATRIFNNLRTTFTSRCY